jgi:ribonuclease HI
VAATLHIYVDGSCEENRNVTAATPAGWGFCVVQGDTGLGRGRGEVITEGFGRVITEEGASGFIGAEVGSNNTAELNAIAGALQWLLGKGGDDSIVIRADSQYALNIARGEWRAKKNRALASRVRAMWEEASNLRELHGEHVRAHRGHRWNERADHLAFRAMSGEEPLPLQFWKPGNR